MPSTWVWNTPKPLSGTAPAPIANGNTGEWSAPTDLSADTDDFEVAGVQVEFTVDAGGPGVVNFHIADSSGAGYRTGGQNEVATLPKIGEVSINGNGTSYTTRIMSLNYIGGAWPPDFILKIDNQAGAAATLTVVKAQYITAHRTT